MSKATIKRTTSLNSIVCYLFLLSIIDVLQDSNGSGSSPKAKSPSYVSKNFFEDLVYIHLVFLRSQILKRHALNSGDSIPPTSLIEARAKEAVQNDLLNRLEHLHAIQGSDSLHKMSAYTMVSNEMMSEMETCLAMDACKEECDRLKLENAALRQQLKEVDISNNNALGVKDQVIETLTTDKKSLEATIVQLANKVQALQKECDVLTQAQTATHSRFVELNLQALDYKSSVERCLADIVQNIRQRVGFVPNGVEKAIADMKAIKAPGEVKKEKTRRKKAISRTNTMESGRKTL